MHDACPSSPLAFNQTELELTSACLVKHQVHWTRARQLQAPGPPALSLRGLLASAVAYQALVAPVSVSARSYCLMDIMLRKCWFLLAVAKTHLGCAW